MSKNAIEIGILRSDLERNPELAQTVKSLGRELVILEDCEVEFSLKVREVLINTTEMMNVLEPILNQRYFGKRGKKGKYKKDWHR